MIHPKISHEVEALVGQITNVVGVGGGCISNASRIEAAGNSFFLKWSAGEAGGTFEAEAAGLKALRGSGRGLVIPEVFAARNSAAQAGPRAGLDPQQGLEPRPSLDQDIGFILMEWIGEGRKGRDFWPRLGTALADLHRHPGSSFGFESDNYIGRIEQINGFVDNWADFFLSNRLEFQRERARDLGRWRSHWDAHFDRLAARLPGILPDTPTASLVHGDLWAGNVIATASGAPVLVDPAAHYAHREVDLAMSELFGGFPNSFYRSYDETWPIEPGYQYRRDIYNLYHLINHLNHFGQSYASQVDGILQAF